METEPQHFWTFFGYSGHSSGELEVHTHTTTMHPGKTTCIRLLRRRRGPSGLHAFILLRREENLPSTTGHDHERTGALRPRPASSTYLHNYLLHQWTTYQHFPGHLWSFSTVRQNVNVNESLKLFYWTFMFSQRDHF